LVCRALGAGLLLSILAGFVQISRMNSREHSDVLPLLELWGASAFKVRVPAMLGGGLLGLSAGAFAAAVWTSFVPELVLHLKSLSPLLGEMANPARVSAVALLACGLLLGAMGGSLGVSSREGHAA
jgi:hypothetical protein